MPSPLGHAIAGITAGLAVAPAPHDRPSWVRSIVLFAVAGTAADLDLLAGAHSGPTHGLGAAVLAGVATFLFLAARSKHARASAAQFALAVTAAYATHTLLDWLGTDTSPPIGIMGLWPFTHQYYESDLHLFAAVSRRYWLMPEFVYGNLRTIWRELLILVPPLLATTILRVRTSYRSKTQEGP